MEKPREIKDVFAFGKNWAQFLRNINDPIIHLAEESLKIMLNLTSLKGMTFLDAGCGSGLFSLAARNLGAEVYSFDRDDDSVGCAAELKRRLYPADIHWRIGTGSILDANYVRSLGQFDVVYSWGVLHHTGDMQRAFENISLSVKNQGLLFVSIYNDEGWKSRVWYHIKRLYVRSPGPFRAVILGVSFARMWFPIFFRDSIQGNPLKTWRNYPNKMRGMSAWRDVVDWTGGFPFEVASADLVCARFKVLGFEIQNVKRCGPESGVNEFVFRRTA